MAILGTNNDDILIGDAGDNTIIAYGGDDKIRAKGGDDLIQGNTGNDDIVSGAGDDTVFGGAGDDEIRGAKGADEMSGGTGADTFIFYAGNDFRIETDDDTIMDYDLGVDSIFVDAPGSYKFDLESIDGNLVADVYTHNGVDRGSITFIGLGEEFADVDGLSGEEFMALLNSAPEEFEVIYPIDIITIPSDLELFV